MTNEELPVKDPIKSLIKLIGIGATTSCLVAIQGIRVTVALIIGKACAASCVTPTLITASIYAACIGVYAVLGTGDIDDAVASFKFFNHKGWYNE